MRTLVLGLGNPILSDDGVGVCVAGAVDRALSPDLSIDVSEVSLGGLGLMERMLGYDRVILIDAFKQDGGETGTIHKLALDELRSASPTQHSASAHDTNLITALDMANRMGLPVPSEITIYAIEVENISDFGEELTPAVAEAVPLVTEAVLSDLGYEQVCSEMSDVPTPARGKIGGKNGFT